MTHILLTRTSAGSETWTEPWCVQIASIRDVRFFSSIPPSKAHAYIIRTNDDEAPVVTQTVEEVYALIQANGQKSSTKSSTKSLSTTNKKGVQKKVQRKVQGNVQALRA